MRGLRRVAAGVTMTLVAMGLGGCDWPDGTRYVDVVFPEVDATLDVAYRTTTDASGAAVELRLDLYRPRGDTVTDRPVLLWMFGGGWQYGDRKVMTSYAVDAARRGYVGVTIDYRIRPEGGELQALAGDAYEDALAAVDWLKDHAADYGIDPGAIVAGGWSAGGINALNLAYWPGERGPVAQSTVAGAVAIGSLSLGTPDGDDPPTLMHHGDADAIVPPALGRSTCDAATAAGASCAFVTYPGADHSVAFTVPQLVQEATADWAYERIVWPRQQGREQ